MAGLPTVSVNIVLEGNLVSWAFITRHLVAIGDTYSQRWSYDRSRQARKTFFSLCGTYVVPAALTRDLGYGAERIELMTEGHLTPGLRFGDDIGFHASVLTGTNFVANDDIQADGIYGIIKSYPCFHIPVPTDW
jgi:hypothetical protein